MEIKSIIAKGNSTFNKLLQEAVDEGWRPQGNTVMITYTERENSVGTIYFLYQQLMIRYNEQAKTKVGV